MSKYLYGASLQGLQEFIFQTNKLKEIIGASEIIKKFDNWNLKEEFNLSKEPEIILQAAGNLRVIFDNEDDAKEIVLHLPKKIMQEAYGISISQGVVEYKNYKEDSPILEKNLKIQRNKKAIPLDFHLSAFQINPRTGLPAVKEAELDKSSFLDKSSSQKLKSYKKASEKDPTLKSLELENKNKIKNKKNKIAIIHIDGNGLGEIVRKLDEKEMREFSQNLNEATNKAYDEALKNKDSYKYLDDLSKIRKVILGGDDLTLICNANIALEFTQKFLCLFECKTKKIPTNIPTGGLTACAGIAYCNEKFPFFYAVKLADDLCTFAKKHSKEINEKLPPSSLMFHNIRSSYVESFENFINDELRINGVHCDFGPYYLNSPNQPSIQSFLDLKNDFKTENSPKGRLRDWLNILKKDKNIAKRELDRIAEIFNPNKWESEHFEKLHKGLSLKKLIIKVQSKEKTPIYDVLQILSVED